jgi:hypothetical protein
VAADWDSDTDPGDVDNALDQLAERVDDLEGAGYITGIDAAAVTYTPAVAADWDSDTDPGDVDNALDQLAERVDDLEGAGGGAGDVTWAIIQASQLRNEIKGWPACVNAGDLDALQLWYRKVGTPTTAPTLQDVSAASLTDTYETCLKVTADASGEGLSQTWTFADEPRVKSGLVLSTIWAIWSVSGVGVTLKLVNSDASHTDATAVTAAAWTIVTVENHTLAGSSCNVALTTDGAGTFYAVPLGACIGAKAVPLGPRPSRYVDGPTPTTHVVSGTDPGATWTDCDLTSATSPLAHLAMLQGAYLNASTGGKAICVRRNGSTVAAGWGQQLVTAYSANTYVASAGSRACALDDGQIFEYIGSDVAADTEECYIQVAGWWEYA